MNESFNPIVQNNLDDVFNSSSLQQVVEFYKPTLPAYYNAPCGYVTILNAACVRVYTPHSTLVLIKVYYTKLL